MKINLPSLFKRSEQVILLGILVFICQSFFSLSARAQIYAPEGINMPGSWNTWHNPPTNLALASSTQVTGGRVVKITTGTPRWQTIFSVGATASDLVGGTYEWLFTSGPATNYFANKWKGVKVTMNTLQTYTYDVSASLPPNPPAHGQNTNIYQSSGNDSVTLVNGNWYSVNWEDLGYINSRAIFMKTSAQPVNFASVSLPGVVIPNAAASVTVTTAVPKSPEEIVYLRYTTDAWATSTALAVTMSGTTGSVSIPGQVLGTTVSYYAFSSTIANLTANFDLCTIKFINNAGLNYSYTVTPPPVITWANLQFPASGVVQSGQTFEVFGRAHIPGVTGQAVVAPGLQAWVGYSTTNTNPNTWTNWIAAPFSGPVGNNDEFKANLGTAIATAGSYYYATRFKLNTDAYVYGGYNGGFWDGTNNVSGTLTVSDPIPNPDFDWVNLQYPGAGNIVPLQEYVVYAQAYIQGVTGQATPAAGVQAWIGYSTSNSNPNTWTNWIPAPYSSAVGNNDEFKTNLGAQMAAAGTYYYTSRFRLNTGVYFYGGYSASGGGFWNGTTNMSGVLQVETPGSGINWANLQFPGSDTIYAQQNLNVYAQVYINGATGHPTPTPGLQSWIGYSTTNSNPSTWTNWVPATYNMAAGNNDEFVANIGTVITQTGTYYYASRFKYNTGTYAYGGYSSTGGGFWDGTANVSGVLTVVPTPSTYPVLFTVIDWTQYNSHIKFKGSMTNWDTVSMVNNNHVWTLTLDLAPGTYEWGAIEDNGLPNGLWLIAGGNLVMNVDNFGVITGTVTYTTLITGIDTPDADCKVYPNPTDGTLSLEIPRKALVNLSDMNGKILLQQNFDEGMHQIDLSGFKPGVYNLEILSAECVKRLKIVRK